MKPRKLPHFRFKARLLPGHLIRLRHSVLKRLGWTRRTPIIFSLNNQGHALVFSKPTETEWRIDRLARRLHFPRVQQDVRCPNSLLEYRRMGLVHGSQYY